MRTIELDQKEAVTLLQRHALPTAPSVCTPVIQVASRSIPRVLVIGRESGRVRRLGDLAVVHFLEGVFALALGVESVHEMHLCG